MRSLPDGMRTVGVVALTLLVLVGMLWLLQRRLIYFPAQEVPPPEDVHPDIEEVVYLTEDGLTLTAWWLAAEPERGTVMVLPGNAGNRAHRVPLAMALWEEGYSVLLVDYRGYGGNPGSPSEDGLAFDALAAHSHIVSDLDPGRLVIFGESLGAGVALGLAAERAPAALVLRSPFTSLADVGRTLYPFLPVSLLLRDRFPNLETVVTVDIPLLVVAGGADSIIPPQQSIDLYQAAPGPKRLMMIEEADHNDFALLAGEEMVSEIISFLDEVLPPTLTA